MIRDESWCESHGWVPKDLWAVVPPDDFESCMICNAEVAVIDLARQQGEAVRVLDDLAARRTQWREPA